MNFIVEKENEYFAYYSVRVKYDVGYIVKALNGQQAIAQVLDKVFHTEKTYFCVKMIESD